MNITHQQLRDIVGKTPEPWWPELCYMGDDAGWWFNRLAVTNHHVQPELAYHAFVGAAVEWLGKRGTIAADGVDPTFGVIWKSDDRIVMHDSTCLLSALIAACRAVKEEQR